MGTAGFARDLVSGYNRVPAPPPKITAATDFVFVTRRARSLRCSSPPRRKIVIARLRDATDEDDAETARPRLREKQKNKNQNASVIFESMSGQAGRFRVGVRRRRSIARVARAFDRPTTRARVTHRLDSNDTVAFVRPFVRPFVAHERTIRIVRRAVGAALPPSFVRSRFL